MTDSSRKSRGSTKQSGSSSRSEHQNATNNQSSSRGKRGGSRGRRGRTPKPIPDLPLATKHMRELLGQNLDDGHYIVFDIETTGGNPDKNGITEIFALKFHRGEVGESFYSLVNPGIPVPPIVRRMTGINNKMLKDQPRINDVIPQFMEFVGDGIFVSHNTIGDMKFIRYFAEKVTGVLPENFFLCTHLLVEKLVSEAPDKSLRGLAEFFKIGTGELHRAEADTYVTLDLFKILKERLRAKSVSKIEEAIRLQGDLESGLRLGWGVPQEKLRGIPPGPGVFFLHDHEGTMLFQSSAVHLDREVRKLSNFVQLPRQLLRLALRAYDLRVKTSPNIFDAMLEEADILHASALKFGPDCWHQRIYQCLCVCRTPEGDLRLTLGAVEADAYRVYGPVKDRKSLGQSLEEVGKIFDKVFTRKGIVLPKESEKAVLSWLDGTLATEVSALAKQRRSMKVLFSPKKRQEISRRLGIKEQLVKIKLPEELQNVLSVSGVIAVPGAGEENWNLHGVACGRPKPMTTQKGQLDTVLTTAAKRCVTEIEKEKALVQGKPLTGREADRVNATLWWIYSARLDGKFVSLDDLKK